MSIESGYRDALGGEIRDVDEGKRQVQVTIPWETLDTYRSDFSKDCFDQHLGRQLPAMCWQHDKREPIGRAVAWSKGARAHEFVCEFSDFNAVPRARQAFSQIQDKHLTDFSFYYDQGKAVPHPTTRAGVRFVQARMTELSPVTVGSIPGAKATGVRAVAEASSVAELVRQHVVTAEEAREILRAAGLELDGERAPEVKERESITLDTTNTSATTANTGARSVTLTFSPDGTLNLTGPTVTAPDDGDGPVALAQACRAALDEAVAVWESDPAQARQLVDAARDGLPDPDEGAPADQAEPVTEPVTDTAEPAPVAVTPEPTPDPAPEPEPVPAVDEVEEAVARLRAIELATR